MIVILVQYATKHEYVCLEWIDDFFTIVMVLAGVAVLAMQALGYK